MFSLQFDNLFSTIDFESFESKENETPTSTASERPALTETTKSFMHFVIIIIIITTLFESQIILAEHECSTNWGDCKSNKSNQIKSNVGP